MKANMMQKNTVLIQQPVKDSLGLLQVWAEEIQMVQHMDGVISLEVPKI